jgi:hypothetical protein
LFKNNAKTNLTYFNLPYRWIVLGKKVTPLQ